MDNQHRIVRPLLALLASVAMVVACDLPLTQPTEEAPTPEEAEPTTASTDQAAFKETLANALTPTDRNYEHLKTYMGEGPGAFEFALWQSEGSPLSPDEAVEWLRSTGLPPSTTASFDLNADVGALLGFDPATFFPGAADLLFSRGWGDGNAEAVLIIRQREDGAYYWSGVLFAPMGFAPPVGPGTTALDAFLIPLLDTLTTMPRDYDALQAFMGDEFWFFDKFSAMNYPPAEATVQLADAMLPSSATVTYDLSVAPATKVDFTLPEADHYVYTTGWGGDGSLMGILLINEAPEGYVWYGVLNYPESAGPPTAGFTLDEFKTELLIALEEQAASRIELMMSSPFTINRWQSQGALHEPSDAYLLLQEWIPTGSIAPQTSSDLDQVTSKLGGQDPHTFFGVGVDYIYAWGWGEDGAAEVILVIDQHPDGHYTWHSILIAPEGF